MSLPVFTKLTRVLPDKSRQHIWVDRDRVIAVEYPARNFYPANAAIGLNGIDKVLYVEEDPEQINMMLGRTP
jgi:hypothetical protein